MFFLSRSSKHWGMCLCAALFSLSTVGCSLGSIVGAPNVREAETNDVIFLGDSIFQLSGEIQDQIELRADTTFRGYAVSGAHLVKRIIAPTVMDQLELAIEDDPNIRVVVGNGGGNDLLFPAALLDPHQCKTRWYRKNLSQKCIDHLDNLYVDAVDLADEIGAAGAEQYYMLGYYYTKNGLLRLDSLEQAINHGTQVLMSVCQNTSTNCTYVDSRPLISDDDIIWDGIHPTTLGSTKIGNLIWESGLKDNI